MKDISEIYDMTLYELKEYVNTLSFEEVSKLSLEYDDDDIDIVGLLDASKLYSYLQWKNGGEATIELFD